MLKIPGIGLQVWGHFFVLVICFLFIVVAVVFFQSASSVLAWTLKNKDESQGKKKSLCYSIEAWESCDWKKKDSTVPSNFNWNAVYSIIITHFEKHVYDSEIKILVGLLTFCRIYRI